LPEGAEWVKPRLRQSLSTIDQTLDGVDRIYALDARRVVDPVTPLSADHRGRRRAQDQGGAADGDRRRCRRQRSRLARLETRCSSNPARLMSSCARTGLPTIFATYWGESVQGRAIRRAGGRGSTELDRHARHRCRRSWRADDERAHDGNAFNLTGPAARTYAEAADLLSKALDRKVAYTAVDGPTFVAESVAHGVPKPYAEFLVAIFVPVANGWTAAVTDGVKTLSGKTPRSLETSIDDLAPRLRAKAA
jgi:hypothetical protein